MNVGMGRKKKHIIISIYLADLKIAEKKTRKEEIY